MIQNINQATHNEVFQNLPTQEAEEYIPYSISGL
jgi:hypothetical protein